MWPFPPIALHEFSWEAFATLITGVLAVGAAYRVGRKQTAISDRQTEILDGQYQLERHRYKAELFEKRFSIYEATKAILHDVISSASASTLESDRNFLVALDQSRFLFAPPVYQSLKELWEDLCRFSANHSEMTHNFESTGGYGDAQIKTKYEYLRKFMHHLENLSDLFGDELQLSEPQRSTLSEADRPFAK